MADFISIRWLDIVDILLVALLIFQLYKIIKGTVAIRIFAGIFAIYLFWKVVEALKMELLTEILGQFIGVGVIALIIVFQQELRRFLLLIGTPDFLRENKTARRLLGWIRKNEEELSVNIAPIDRAVKSMAKTKTGALIVIERNSNLDFLINSEHELDAKLSQDLLENIFFKNSPLHDGAVIIRKNRIKSARAVLPVSENPDIPAKFGMRHRAALGITEDTDSVAIIVSEQTGDINLATEGKLQEDIAVPDFFIKLKKALTEN